jgi:hypothetical protein
MALNDQHLNEVRKNSLQTIYELWKMPPAPYAPGTEFDRWSGHAGALIQYARAADEEWRRRQNSNDRHAREWLDDYATRFPNQWDMPEWFGNAAFHKAERDLLRQIDPEFYANLSERTTAR